MNAALIGPGIRLSIMRILHRFSPAALYGAAWTLMSVHRARRVLAREGVTARIAPPPFRWKAGGRGVMAALGRLAPTCLERATVLQTWLTAHGQNVEIIIGVGADERGDAIAHAWIEGDRSAAESHRYKEIHRISSSRSPC